MDVEQSLPEACNEQSWARFIEAERRELEDWCSGHLRKLLGDPLPGESPEDLERLALEDEARAKQGLVSLMSPDGEITYKHINELIPEDRAARIAASSVQVEWFAERLEARYLVPAKEGVRVEDYQTLFMPSESASEPVGLRETLNGLCELLQRKALSAAGLTDGVAVSP